MRNLQLQVRCCTKIGPLIRDEFVVVFTSSMNQFDSLVVRLTTLDYFFVPPWMFISENGFNPLRSNSGQRQISLCNTNTFSVREVMRIKDMITQLEFR